MSDFEPSYINKVAPTIANELNLPVDHERVIRLSESVLSCLGSELNYMCFKPYDIRAAVLDYAKTHS